MRLSAIDKPILTVVLPIPARVGEIELTRTRRLQATRSSLINERGTFAIYLP